MQEVKELEGLLAVDGPAVALSHELKAPLCLLRQLGLRLGDISEDSRSVQKVAGQIEATSARALRLVSDLCRVARLADGLFELGPVNPHALCEEVAENLADAYILNKRRLYMRLHGRGHLVVANRELLTTVLYNFCDNAMHYSGQETPSELFTRMVKSSLRIGVRDYGPAMPLKLWRSVNRDSGDLSPAPIGARPQSSGLGLFIASKMTNAMRGKMGIIRHRDGTSIFIDLPLSSQMSWL